MYGIVNIGPLWSQVKRLNKDSEETKSHFALLNTCALCVGRVNSYLSSARKYWI